MASGGAGAAASLARRLADAALRVFGTVVGTPDRSGRKLLAKPLIGEAVRASHTSSRAMAPRLTRSALSPLFFCPQVASYYGRSAVPTEVDPLYEDPLEKRRKVKLERLKRRGKGPPKKGQGKRAAKR